MVLLLLLSTVNAADDPATFSSSVEGDIFGSVRLFTDPNSGTDIPAGCYQVWWVEDLNGDVRGHQRELRVFQMG